MTSDAPVHALDPERLLPAEPGTRAIARRLYSAVPIISPHGHVPPQWLADDTPFADPTSLLLTPDHYIFRLLHAQGIDLADLGVGGHELDEAGSRQAWRTFCEHWRDFRGTPSRYWMEAELGEIFGVTVRPSAETADGIYDQIAQHLATPEFRPRALMERFGIEVLATTDDPVDDLSHHRALHADDTFTPRVVPTFRPDRYLEPAHADFPELVAALGAASGEDTGSCAGYLAALKDRRRYFAEHGAVSADHSHADVVTLSLDEAEATRIYAAALRGEASEDEATALRRHVLVEMALMSLDDGLVMTLHPGVHRNHSTSSFDAYGPDTGHDIPIAVEFTRSLGPLLDRVGTSPGLQLVLFTLDETDFSREIAPLAGFHESVYAGAPWWFLDAPEAVRRFRGGRHRDGRLLSDLRLHRRHPRLPVHPGQARHVPPARQRLPGATRRRAPTPGGRGAGDGDRPRHDDPPEGVQAVTDHQETPMPYAAEPGHEDADLPAGPASPGALRRLNRRSDGRAAAPVRMVHLGVGNFFRAHAAWYTEHASDASEWGIAAFTGRSAQVAEALARQDGLYTLLVRGPQGARPEVISSLTAVHPAADVDALRRYFANPGVAVVTSTVTEAGYRRDESGGLDVEDPQVATDLTALQADPVGAVVVTTPGKLVAGLLSRRAAGAGAIALVPNDNVPDNGDMLGRIVRDFAALVDDSLPAWIEAHVSCVTTMVDRITPRSTDEDRAEVARQLRVDDPETVQTEPFTEWILAGDFPAGRPVWESAGARFVDDVRPFEQRKLWLLNGSHSLMAYAASALGHETVADAIADPVVRDWVEEWWDAASAHLSLPAADITDYRHALLERYRNPQIRHLLAQIAADGSQKVPIRALPVIRAELAEGALAPGSTRIVAAWIAHLRGHGAPVTDPGAAEFVAAATGSTAEAVRRVLARLGLEDEGIAALAQRQLTDLEAKAVRPVSYREGSGVRGRRGPGARR